MLLLPTANQVLALPLDCAETERLEVAYELVSSAPKNGFYEWGAAKLIVTKYLRNESFKHVSICY